MLKPAVLIIGAGPTGLMMACQLSRFNIPFRIIDKNSGPSERSKALAIQSRSLEIYDQMGIAETAVNEGHETKVINLMVKGRRIQRIPLNEVGKDLSPFPFLHIFEQNKNEKLLIEYLSKRNINVEWNTRLVNISNHSEGVKAIVVKNDVGEEINSSWIFGADGGHSTVRQLLGIDFPGDTYENIFYVADTAVNWRLNYGELVGYLSRRTITAFFPMKGERRFRLVGILPKKFHDVDDVTFDDIKNSIMEAVMEDLTFSDTRWFSVYKLHHRCVENFRSGRCFLGGDAAHVHSPAGGQGMNTGLQDAYNLAWKIALVEKKMADQSILDTYNEERLPFAKRLVKTTDRAFGFGISTNPVTRFIRINVFPWLARALMQNNRLRTFVYKAISQISIKYPDSKLSRNDLSRSANVKAGYRLPYCLVQHESSAGKFSLYDLMKEPLFHVLIFDKNQKDSISESIKFFFSNQDLFRVLRLEYSGNEEVYKLFGVSEVMICIIRPDNYIGYLSDHWNVQSVSKYCKLFNFQFQ